MGDCLYIFEILFVCCIVSGIDGVSLGTASVTTKQSTTIEKPKVSLSCVLYGDAGCQRTCEVSCLLYGCECPNSTCRDKMYCEYNEVYHTPKGDLTTTDFRTSSFDYLWDNAFETNADSNAMRNLISSNANMKALVSDLIKDPHVSGEEIKKQLIDTYPALSNEFKNLVSVKRGMKADVMAGNQLQYEDLVGHFDGLVQGIKGSDNELQNIQYRRRISKILESINDEKELNHLVDLVKLSNDENLYNYVTSVLKKRGYAFETNGAPNRGALGVNNIDENDMIELSVITNLGQPASSNMARSITVNDDNVPNLNAQGEELSSLAKIARTTTEDYAQVLTTPDGRSLSSSSKIPSGDIESARVTYTEVGPTNAKTDDLSSLAKIPNASPAVATGVETYGLSSLAKIPNASPAVATGVETYGLSSLAKIPNTSSAVATDVETYGLSSLAKIPNTSSAVATDVETYGLSSLAKIPNTSSAVATDVETYGLSSLAKIPNTSSAVATGVETYGLSSLAKIPNTLSESPAPAINRENSRLELTQISGVLGDQSPSFEDGMLTLISTVLGPTSSSSSVKPTITTAINHMPSATITQFVETSPKKNLLATPRSRSSQLDNNEIENSVKYTISKKVKITDDASSGSSPSATTVGLVPSYAPAEVRTSEVIKSSSQPSVLAKAYMTDTPNNMSTATVIETATLGPSATSVPAASLLSETDMVRTVESPNRTSLVEIIDSTSNNSQPADNFLAVSETDANDDDANLNSVPTTEIEISTASSVSQNSPTTVEIISGPSNTVSTTKVKPASKSNKKKASTSKSKPTSKITKSSAASVPMEVEITQTQGTPNNAPATAIEINTFGSSPTVATSVPATEIVVSTQESNPGSTTGNVARSLPTTAIEIASGTLDTPSGSVSSNNVMPITEIEISSAVDSVPSGNAAPTMEIEISGPSGASSTSTVSEDVPSKFNTPITEIEVSTLNSSSDSIPSDISNRVPARAIEITASQSSANTASDNPSSGAPMMEVEITTLQASPGSTANNVSSVVPATEIEISSSNSLPRTLTSVPTIQISNSRESPGAVSEIEISSSASPQVLTTSDNVPTIEIIQTSGPANYATDAAILESSPGSISESEITISNSPSESTSGHVAEGNNPAIAENKSNIISDVSPTLTSGYFPEYNTPEMIEKMKTDTLVDENAPPSSTADPLTSKQVNIVDAPTGEVALVQSVPSAQSDGTDTEVSDKGKKTAYYVLVDENGNVIKSKEAGGGSGGGKYNYGLTDHVRKFANNFKMSPATNST